MPNFLAQRGYTMKKILLFLLIIIVFNMQTLYARDNRSDVRKKINDDGWSITTLYRVDHWRYASFAAKLASSPYLFASDIAQAYDDIYTALGNAQLAKAAIEVLTDALKSGKKSAKSERHEVGLKLLTYNHWHEENPCSIWGGKCWKKFSEPNTHEFVMVTRPLSRRFSSATGSSSTINNDTIYFLNKCRKKIQTAITYKDVRGNWRTEGWWTLEPGKKANVANTKNRTYYIYAESIGSKSERTYWSGNDIHEKIRNSSKKYGFLKKKISMDKWGTWTHSFTCN